MTQTFVERYFIVECKDGDCWYVLHSHTIDAPDGVDVCDLDKMLIYLDECKRNYRYSDYRLIKRTRTRIEDLYEIPNEVDTCNSDGL